MKRIAIILVFLLIILHPACKDEVICTQDVVSRVDAGLYVRDHAAQRDTVLNGVTFYGVFRPDSLLYDSSQGIRRIKFPLPQGAGEYTGFVMRAGSLADTILIFHDSRQELVSFSCGFTTVHEIYGLGYGNHIIDTIEITNPFVDLSDEENLKIYIRPAVGDTAV